MAKQTRSIQKKTLNAPDEIRTFDKGKVELATVGTVTFGRASFEPGWKWSESVKPAAKKGARKLAKRKTKKKR